MSERYRREIEDILGEVEELPVGAPQPKKPSFIRESFAYIGQALSGGGRISPGKILLLSLVFVLVAALFNAALPGFIIPILLWSAVIIFIVGYALFFINTSEPYEKRWRGQVLEGPPTVVGRLRRWIKGK